MATGDSIQYAGEYKLLECKILSSTGVVARLDSIVQEINIFENIVTQGIMVSLVIVDSNNLVMNMPIVGQEFVTLKLQTPGLREDETTIDYTENCFSVYKVGARSDIANSSQVYELSLISPETLRNGKKRISKSYEGEISDIFTNVMRDEKIINTNKDIHVDRTSKIKKYVAPNLRPYTFIRNLSREATSFKYSNSPHYFFYETIRGYQFRVLDSLYAQPSRSRFLASEPGEIDTPSKVGNLEKDFERILSIGISQSNDTFVSGNAGMFGSSLIKYNIFHKNYETYTHNYFENFEDYGRIDENPIYNQTTIDKFGNTLGDFPDAQRHIHASSNNGSNNTSHYNTDTGYSYQDNNAEDWLLSKRAKLVEMLNGGMAIQLKVHGRTTLTVGDKIDITLPVTGKDHGKSKIDTFYQGEFLITKLRHRFDQADRRHTMMIHAVKDGIPVEFQNSAKSTEPTGEVGQTITY